MKEPTVDDIRAAHARSVADLDHIFAAIDAKLQLAQRTALSRRGRHQVEEVRATLAQMRRTLLPLIAAAAARDEQEHS